MHQKKYLPQSKDDKDFIYYLNKLNAEEIQDDVPILLEWLQDGNWPAAKPVADFLISQLKLIQTEILDVLKSKDEVWKYWIIESLLIQTNISLHETILRALARISVYPTESEKETGLNTSAQAVLQKQNQRTGTG